MNLEAILSQLKSERQRIDDAIGALEKIGALRGRRPSVSANRPAKRKRRLTREGRKRLSEMMKKRWAERRKQKQ